MLYKTCRCGKLIDYGKKKYCDECSVKVEAEKKQRYREYDKKRKEDSFEKKLVDFYKSKQWKKVREIVLNMYNGLDLYTYYIENRIEYATTIHHIVEVREDWDKRLDISNLIPLSYESHNKIHSMYDKDCEGTKKMLSGLIERWKSEYSYGE